MSEEEWGSEREGARVSEGKWEGGRMGRKERGNEGMKGEARSEWVRACVRAWVSEWVSQRVSESVSQWGWRTVESIKLVNLESFRILPGSRNMTIFQHQRHRYSMRLRGNHCRAWVVFPWSHNSEKLSRGNPLKATDTCKNSATVAHFESAFSSIGALGSKSQSDLRCSTLRKLPPTASLPPSLSPT